MTAAPDDRTGAPDDRAPVRPPAPSTLAVTAGRPARMQGGPVNPPVVLSSTYVSTGVVPPGEHLLNHRASLEFVKLKLEPAGINA